ncbi:MAG: FkbM family methyltransferase [Bacteroidetes bacterium]|nr:FkbM family methyltransferase [Bacteroidota bacterium]
MLTLLKDLYDRDFRPVSIMDIGANNGAWSKMAKKVFRDSVFYMIEPLEEMEKDLAAFCSENPGSKYFICGAGSREEFLYLTIGGENLTGSNFVFGENEFLKKESKQRPVQIRTMDSLIDSGEIIPPQFVKMDIQGFELEALKGGERLFEKADVFILETNCFEFMKGVPLVHEVIIYFAERDFVIYDFPGFLRRPFDGALAQMDICFVRKDNFLRDTNQWDVLPSK